MQKMIPMNNSTKVVWRVKALFLTQLLFYEENGGSSFCNSETYIWEMHDSKFEVLRFEYLEVMSFFWNLKKAESFGLIQLTTEWEVSRQITKQLAR